MKAKFKKQRPNKLRFYCLGLALALLFCLAPAAALAYFDRGPVNVTVGQSSVAVAPGNSVTVSVATSPSSSSQLPGCGMAECPQTCGEKECLDANGECSCNGLEYKTYYTDVAVATSNSSVAKAAYNNGVVTITGVSAGETNITVTAMLRQFSQTSQTIQVTVAGAGTASKQQTAKLAAEPQGGGVQVVQPDDNQEKEVMTVGGGELPEATQPNEEQPEQPQSAAAGVYTVTSDRGPITFVPIDDGLMGKEALTAVQGQTAYVVFQKKDAADTILYAWEFAGQDLTEAADLDLNINISQTSSEQLTQQIGGANALYLDFAQSGALPGPAQVSLQVKELFANGTLLNLYFYNEAAGVLEPAAQQLAVENGYVVLPLTHCSQYVLTEAALEKQDSGPGWWLWFVVAALVVAIVLVFVGKKQKAAKK